MSRDRNDEINLERRQELRDIALVAYAFASYLVITLIKLMFNRRL
jgi:hypothetical protein